MKREKVYCKNCKYRGLLESLLCTFEDRFTNTGDYTRLKSQKNKYGDCKDYMRIWWKVWLTEDKTSTVDTGDVSL